MIKIPDYQNDTIREISQENFDKNFNLKKISFGRFSSDDYTSLVEKLPKNFTKESILLILELYNSDLTVGEIQDFLRKKGCPATKYVILAILKKNSPRFREFGWRLAYNRKATQEFFECRTNLGDSQAISKITKKFALTKPTFLSLLDEKGVQIK